MRISKSADSLPRPIFMVPNHDETDGADAMILNPENTAIEGDDSPALGTAIEEADIPDSWNGFNHATDGYKL